MKRLLLLGGSRYALPVIRAAHKLGIYVITCDYLPNNIAHKYSDQYCNISIIEKEIVLETAKKMKIDGIMSFACDPGVITAAYVAEKLGLPSCGPYESVAILQNKKKFREFLKEHGFHVPMAKGYTVPGQAERDIGLFHWPVIVKPTDSAGSKGVIRVDNPKDLKKSIQYALCFSHLKEFIIEDFLLQKGYSSDTDSFSVDGELKFVSFNCQWFDSNAENPYTPSAYSWPSSISGKGIEELSGEIKRLFKLLGMGTSIYNIETRECVDGKTYIMECSPRGGGNRLAEIIQYATGTDLISNAVRAAIGEPVIGIEQKPYKGYWAEIILHSGTGGVFQNLWISDKISKFVVEKDLWVKKGTKIKRFSAANEAIGTLILKTDSQGSIEEILSNQDKYLKVEAIKE
ncbi:MAG: ATP-grasp domain-containing protein [Lachnospiraceae bacterium]|nr:ATP-grasp domain-containing protein [Lachnospiraceae bacterium]